MNTGKKILIIEDGTTLLAELQYIANKFDLEFFSTDGVVQFQDIKTLSPELIIFYNWINDQSVIDLCFDLRTSAITEKILIIILAEYNSHEKIALESCADFCIKKPYNINQLLLLIVHMLQSPC